jgi:hypothetical protein
MWGCIGRIGCVVLLVLAAAAGWFTHDAWYPKLRARLGGKPVPAAAAPRWEPLTPEGAARARLALGKLSARSGPVYIDVAAGDLAAYALQPALRALSHDSVGAEALARDERIYVRARVNVAELGDARALGPLASVLRGKQEITVRGTLEVMSTGHAQFRVDQIALKDLQLPQPLIEQIVGRMQVGPRGTTTPTDAILVTVPRELGDVRITRGHVVLYKSIP